MATVPSEKGRFSSTRTRPFGNVLDPVRSALAHPPSDARRTPRSTLARERDEDLLPAVGALALNVAESMRQDAAVEIRLELVLHERRQRRDEPLFRRGLERAVRLGHDLIQRAALGAMAAILEARGVGHPRRTAQSACQHAPIRKCGTSPRRPTCRPWPPAAIATRGPRRGVRGARSRAITRRMRIVARTADRPTYAHTTLDSCPSSDRGLAAPSD